jgi:hypothetical protein
MNDMKTLHALGRQAIFELAFAAHAMRPGATSGRRRRRAVEQKPSVPRSDCSDWRGGERIFDAIDGRRTIGEIVDRTGANGGSLARSFFEKLWRYDQVSFDASNAATR